MNEKAKLLQGFYDYLRFKIAQAGHFKLLLPKELVYYLARPFLNYYMSNIEMQFEKGNLKLKGSSLVPIAVIFSNPKVMEEEVRIPFKTTEMLKSFINSFAASQLKHIKIQGDELIIPLKKLKENMEDFFTDFKIKSIEFVPEGIEIKITIR